MTPTLIVLGLLALGAGIVAWATRHRPGQPRVACETQDVVWNDPITSASTIAAVEVETPDGSFTPDDPFAHAPDPGVETIEENRP